MWQAIIHGLFVLSAIGIAYVEQLGPAGLRQTASLERLQERVPVRVKKTRQD